MVDTRRIVSNPLLELITKPRREKVTGGSKDPSKIKPEVYVRRQAALLSAIDAIRTALKTQNTTHGGHVLLWARMDPDSIATTHTPNDLFDVDVGARLVSAWRMGYVIDITIAGLSALRARVQNPTTGRQRCDIFRIERLELFATELLATADIDADWLRSEDSGAGVRAFGVALPSFRAAAARRSVIDKIQALLRDQTIYLAGDAATRLLESEEGPQTDGVIPSSAWLAPSEASQSVTVYEERWPRRIVLGVAAANSLVLLIESGAIVRWEPVQTLRPALPGDGPEPDVELPIVQQEPIVGIIDGGYHANRYRNVVAWRQEPPFVPDHQAARQHGNKVASIVVDGHLWSNQLKLPQLFCRIGVVQALPARGAAFIRSYSELIAYIERAFIDHPDTLVWNFSANLDGESDAWSVSDLGHALSQIARKHKRLLVISAGNKDRGTHRVSPPADCDAAIVVGGRAHDFRGEAAGACSASRTGLGPEGMLKPETSWFSEHRVLGGGLERGTSYSAPLVSRLAAHTWQNLTSPSPDMVRGLLINACDAKKYDHAIGFGSPIRPEEPWLCSGNAVVLAWSADIISRYRYYWTGIRIPPSMIQDGRIVGRLKLVAILDPVVQTTGHHYVSTRIETGLQYERRLPDGKIKNVRLVGCMNPKEREDIARRDDHKWHPVRVYEKEFTVTNGEFVSGGQPTLQVYARVFWRNAFQYSEDFMTTRPLTVNFVITMESPDVSADTYDEFIRSMSTEVRSAVITQDVEVDNEDEE